MSRLGDILSKYNLIEEADDLSIDHLDFETQRRNTTAQKEQSKLQAMAAQAKKLIDSANPMNWSIEETKRQIKLNPPKTLDEEITAKTLLKTKEEREKAILNKQLEKIGLKTKEQKEDPQVSLTRYFEGYRDKIYPDSQGNLTIGTGIKIKDPLAQAMLPREVLTGLRPITPEEDTTFLKKRLKIAQDDAKKFIGSDVWNAIPEPAKIVLTDMSYNMGLSRLSTFKNMKKAIEEGNFKQAAKEMYNSKWYRDVGPRRANPLIQMMYNEGVMPEPLKKEEKTKKIDLSLLDSLGIKEAFAEEGITPKTETEKSDIAEKLADFVLNIGKRTIEAPIAPPGIPLEITKAIWKEAHKPEEAVEKVIKEGFEEIPPFIRNNLFPKITPFTKEEQAFQENLITNMASLAVSPEFLGSLSASLGPELYKSFISSLQQKGMAKIERAIPIFEKAGVKFPEGMSARDKVVTILRIAQVNPKMGDAVKIILSTPTEVYGGGPSTKEIMDLAKKFNLTEPQIEAIRKGIYTGLPAQVIEAIGKIRPKEEIIPPLEKLHKERWIAGAEPIAAIPGEPIEFLDVIGDDFNTAKAALFETEEGKYYVRKADGMFIKNPKDKEGLPYFNTAEEAKIEAIRKIKPVGEARTPYDTSEIIEARKKSETIPETIKINTPERQAFRQQKANEYYGTGAINKNKRIDIVMGLPASGKSKQIVEPLAKQYGSIIIDTDEIKRLIPEYKTGIEAKAVHKESTEISETNILPRAVKAGDNIVYPIIGKNFQRVKTLIEELKKEGYEVNLHFADLSPEKATQRSIERFYQTGRFVDPDYIYNQLGLTPSENYDKLKMEEGVDSYVKYSTDVPRGQQPKILEQRFRRPGQLQIGQGYRGVEKTPQGEITPPLPPEKPPAPPISPEEPFKPKRPAPNLSKLKGLQNEIASIQERQTKIEQAQDSLNEINKIRDYFRRSIKKYKKGYLEEELSGIPSIYITKKPSGITPDEVLGELRNKFGIDLKNESELKEYLIELENNKKSLQAIIEEEKPGFITMKETTLLKEKIRMAEQGYKEGAIQTKEAIRKTQTLVIEALEDSELSLDDKGKFLRAIKNANTPENFERTLSDIRERIETLEDRANRKYLVSSITKLKDRLLESPSIAVDYKEKIKNLLSSFELKEHTPEKLAILKTAQDYFSKEIQQGKDVVIPKKLLEDMEILSRKPLKDITTKELEVLKDRLELLGKLGKTKYKTIKALYEAEKENIKTALLQNISPIETLPILEPKIGEKLSFREKLENLKNKAINEARRIDLAITPSEVIFDILDGAKGTYSGAHIKFIKRPTDVNYGTYLLYRNEIQESVLKFSDKLGLTDENFQRVGIHAIRAQKGGLKKLLDTGYDINEINAVKLSDKELALYRMMRSILDGLRPKIKEIMRIYYNKELGEVEEYFSFMTDFKAMDEAEIYQRFGENVEEYGRPTKNPELGYTKTRTLGKQKILVNAMDIFLRHTDNVAYLLKVAPYNRMLFEIVNSPEYKEVAGPRGQRIVLEWLDLMSRKGGGYGYQQIQWLDTVRKNIGVGILGFKLSSALIQPSSLIDAASYIGNYAFKGANNIATSKEWRKMILNFPEIKARIGDDPAFKEFGVFKDLQRSGYWLIQNLDKITAMATASGAYEKKILELGESLDFANPNKEAMEYAQFVVRRTQASALYKDLPLAISKGALTGNKSIDKALFQFQTFLLNKWSILRHDVIRAGLKERNYTASFTKMLWLILATLTATGIRTSLKKGRELLFGEDRYNRNTYFAQEFLKEGLSNVPFIGQMSSIWNYDSYPVPAIEAPVALTRAVKRVVTGKKPETKLRGVAGLVGAGGKLLGIPGATQAEETARDIIREKRRFADEEDIINDRIKEILAKYGVSDNMVESRIETILGKYNL